MNKNHTTFWKSNYWCQHNSKNCRWSD